MSIKFRRSAKTSSRRARNYKKKKIFPSMEFYSSHADFGETLAMLLSNDILPIVGLAATAGLSAVLLAFVLTIVF